MSLALYRKYRPGKFSDVIGQEHVTTPLMRALDNDRLHHAYLFTGPRGCGKTSSARIMARSMNCVSGPTSTPCETCQSCLELAPNGPGSIDVIEIDAATYRGIEDAKELRERAVYAPVSSRYKVYIIDEAHQLTRDAFNVLLKLVEEPPPHLRFIFATTEPDKIIPTLRSRTHHYGFRLVSAKMLQEHLAGICANEGVAAEPAALALVARAGAGSVRDSQSVLGQMIAGSGAEGITYAQTVAQLGFTDEALLSRTVTAIAQADAAALFALVDEVVASGHEPRRFVLDLLERLRDLVVIQQVPDAASSGLFDMPAEQIADLVNVAGLYTPGQLVRVADLVSAGLSTLRGASSPRLQLELLVARLVTPQVSQDLAERVAKLEQGGFPSATRPSQRPASNAATANDQQSVTAAQPAAQIADPVHTEVETIVRNATPPAPKRSTAPPPLKPSQVTSTKPATHQVEDEKSEPAEAVKPTAMKLENFVAAWPMVHKELFANSKVASLVMAGTVPIAFSEDGLLTVAFASQNNALGASKNGHDERLRKAIATVLQVNVRLELVVDAIKTAQESTAVIDPEDLGEANPEEDEVLTSKSALDLVTSVFGGEVVETSENSSQS